MPDPGELMDAAPLGPAGAQLAGAQSDPETDTTASDTVEADRTAVEQRAEHLGSESEAER
jgi:hypothetical protein